MSWDDTLHWWYDSKILQSREINFRNLGLYSQFFIFFGTNEQAHKARVL
jgi:hypothetical protein